MREYYRTFSDFADNPTDATYYGYQPSYFDCLSIMAGVVEFNVLKRIPVEFYNLLDERLRDLPFELFKLLLATFLVLTIPFGGFFVYGTLGYIFKYRPAILKPKMEKLHKDMESQW